MCVRIRFPGWPYLVPVGVGLTRLAALCDALASPLCFYRDLARWARRMGAR